MKNKFYRNTKTYIFLIGICVVILLLEWLVISILDAFHMGEYVNDAIAEGVIFFICVPGILTGIIGAIVCKVTGRKKR